MFKKAKRAIKKAKRAIVNAIPKIILTYPFCIRFNKNALKKARAKLNKIVMFFDIGVINSPVIIVLYTLACVPTFGYEFQNGFVPKSEVPTPL